MRLFQPTGRTFVRIALCAATAALVTACASDKGEKVVDAPFPELADVPPRPEAGTTAEERAELRAQLKRRRDEINRAANSLLRGGTEPVPVALDSRVPGAPRDSGAQTAPPPLPAGFPLPPERPSSLPEADSPEEADGGAAEKNPSAQASGEALIEAPEAEQMPPAKAAGEKEKEEGGSQDDPDGES